MRDMMPHILPVYPPNNFKIFEEWFAEKYKGCNTDRELLPFFPTSYWVNNNYAQDLVAKKEAQDYIDSLPNDKKYFGICQYDDGFLIDWKDKDVLEFNMSKRIGVEIPLLCQPHPYSFSSEKKYIANFVGSRTHPIRNELEKFKDKDGWYISFENHSIEKYCEIISQSYFTLCPRGYGSNSFRICEAMQYGSIPVYITDELIEPFNVPFYLYGVPVDFSNLWQLEDWLNIEKRHDEYLLNNIPVMYEGMYTYDGCFKNIIKSLETEYNLRQQGGEKGKINEGVASTEHN